MFNTPGALQIHDGPITDIQLDRQFVYTCGEDKQIVLTKTDRDGSLSVFSKVLFFRFINIIVIQFNARLSHFFEYFVICLLLL